MSLSERVKQLCEHRNITINQMEKDSGVGRGSVARWDTHSPSVEKVVLVARYFGVPIDYLLTGEEQKETPTPVSEDGLDDQDKQLMGLMKALTGDQKEFLLAQLLTLTGQGK